MYAQHVCILVDYECGEVVAFAKYHAIAVVHAESKAGVIGFFDSVFIKFEVGYTFVAYKYSHKYL